MRQSECYRFTFQDLLTMTQSAICRNGNQWENHAVPKQAICTNENAWTGASQIHLYVIYKAVNESLDGSLPRLTRSGHCFTTYWHLIYTPNIEVLKSVTLILHLFQAYRVVWKGVKGVYTAMVNDPFRKWDRVDTFCTLLVDLGSYIRIVLQIKSKLTKGCGTGSIDRVFASLRINVGFWKDGLLAEFTPACKHFKPHPCM